MTRTLVAFAVVGGIAVPIVFVLLGFALGPRAPGDATLALLHGVQLPLWPMSKLILDDPSGKHWLYLPLAAVLSNALIYGAVGLLAGWGRVQRAGFVAALLTVLAMLVAAWQGFGTSGIGFAIAAAVALGGLILHRLAAR
jgi:hypothetical protein